MLAGVLDLIRSENINVEEIENVVFDGGVAACCTMKLMSEVSAKILKEMSENPNVISTSQVKV